MTPIRELADKIGAAVVACVNRDLASCDMLILNNIEQVVEDALILHGRPTAADHLQTLRLVAEAQLCCDSVAIGIDSLLARQTVPAAVAELTALKRMADRTAEAMDALRGALQARGEKS